MGEIKPDEFAHGFDVASETDEFLSLVALHSTAVAGAHRINEDEIRLIEPRIFVVHKLVWRRGHHAFRLHAHALGTDDAKVKPNGSRARTTIERERERPLFRRLAIQR